MKVSYLLLALFLSLSLSTKTFAEDDTPKEDESVQVPGGPGDSVNSGDEQQKPKKNKYEHRKFVTDHPERSDAGIFHVAAAVGGNFYVEPALSATTKAPTGDYFKDFGFQAGVYFDYDYSQMPENIPLALRGMVGYKYILSSVHVFAFDAMARRMFNLSENTTMGIGFGGEAAIWYRQLTDTSTYEEVIFLPSVIAGVGFEFNPLMVDIKWLVNRIGVNSTITGVELYFGFRL